MNTSPRYAADYVASLDDMPTGDNWDPADIKCTTIYGDNLKAVVNAAQDADINGECYHVRCEEWLEVYPGDGIYDWEETSSYDPWTLQPTEY
jgi:hypothetical protein